MELPNLETLELPPSWCMLSIGEDRATRIDRSACLEVTVKEVRRLAHCVAVNPNSGKRRGAAGVLPLPHERAARTRDGRLATGVFEIHARMLAWLSSRRPARKLQGDFRGTKSNAMRPVGWRPGDGVPTGVADALKPIPRQSGTVGHLMRNSWGERGPNGRRTAASSPVERVRLENVLPGNPNRLGPFDPGSLEPWARERQVLARGGGGESARKVLAVAEDWCQPLRLEKWQLSPGRPPFYYLVCPGCHRQVGEPMEAEWADDGRLPGLSRMPRGRNAWRSMKEARCPHRVVKLYLPLATAAEARDAWFAHQWYALLPVRQRTTAEAKRVLARYGALFPPRALMCRYCLGIGYGNHPENARQGAARRRAREKAAP